MKFKIMLCTCLMWLCTVNTKAQSCCASGSSSCSMGGGGNTSIMPELDKHIIGLNYTYGLYHTTIYSGQNVNTADPASLGQGEATKGTVNTLQLYGRFNLPKRFQISVSVPVHFLKEQNATYTEHSAGLGDVSVMAFYSVFAPQKFVNKNSKHQLRIGMGVKAPTGKFSMNSDGLFTTDLQLGTGSVDFLFNLSYVYRYKRFGVSVSPMYKKNLVNRDHYQFGDNAGGALSLFYLFNPAKQLAITPRVGAAYSHTFFNSYNKQLLTGTGGDVLRASAGLDIYYKNVAFSTSVAPVLLTVNNWQGESVPVISFEAGIYYSFSRFGNHKNKNVSK